MDYIGILAAIVSIVCAVTGLFSARRAAQTARRLSSHLETMGKMNVRIQELETDFFEKYEAMLKRIATRQKRRDEREVESTDSNMQSVLIPE